MFLLFPTVTRMPRYDKQFKSYSISNSTGLLKFKADQIGATENFKLLSLVQVQGQKTSNTKLVVNFLSFPVITHMLKSDEQRGSYFHRNTIHMFRNFQQQLHTSITLSHK
jgi:hypothetical protein